MTEKNTTDDKSTAKYSRSGAIFIVDLKEKIKYLIRVRKDRRSLSRNERSITNETMLAFDIGVTPSHLSHSKSGTRGLPPFAVKRTSEIFAVDEPSLIVDAIETFKSVCEGKLLGQEESRNWRHIVQHASEDFCSVILDAPLLSVIKRTRYAGPEGKHPEKAPLAKIPVGKPFWVAIRSPIDAESRPTWGDWNILMFNHSLGLKGFSSLLPRFAQDFGFPEMKFPTDQHTLWFPRARKLTHPQDDVGYFEVIIVVSKDPVPPNIAARFSLEDAEGLAIENPLEELARWIGAGKEDEICVTKVRYEVILGTT